MSEFKKEIKFIPSHGNMDIKFLLHGEKGIIQFAISTGWDTSMTGFDKKVTSYAYDVGYHSPVPMYEDQKPMEKCQYFDPCYYDGSSLCAHQLFDQLIECGEDHVWYKLEKFYHDWLMVDNDDEA